MYFMYLFLVMKGYFKVDRLIRKSISEIIKNHFQLVSIAIGQRAKFEGWLKFELANHLKKIGMSNVEVESAYTDSNSRADLGFVYKGIRYDIELKTPNTNWRIKGIESKGRPITKNIDSIINDSKKLEKCVGNGIVAFVLFPIPVGDDRWKQYLDRISNRLDMNLTEKTHCNKVEISVGDSICEVVVCCFNT